MIGRLTFDRAQAIRGTFTRRYALRISTRVVVFFYSNQNGVVTRARFNTESKQKEEEEEEERFCFRATTNVFTLLVEYVSDGSKTHQRVIVKGRIN